MSFMIISSRRHVLTPLQLRKPHYQLFLGDSKLDKVIVPPIKITDIPLPHADGTLDEPREYTLTFPAPPQANLYSFVIHAASDTFLGANVEHPIMVSRAWSAERMCRIIHSERVPSPS
jgi:hypothetical protein